MANRNAQAIVRENQEYVSEKKAYTKPKATFVRLKLEETITMCGRNFKGCAIKGVS